MSQPHNAWWTQERADRAVGILRGHDTMRDALAALSRAFGIPISKDYAGKGLKRFGHRPPTYYLRSRAESLSEPFEADIPIDVDETWDDKTDPAIDAPTPQTLDRFTKLVDVVKRHSRAGGLEFEALCDALDLTPSRTRALLDDARVEGVSIDISHGKLHFKLPEPEPSKPAVSVTPFGAGREHRIAVFSDLHFGSKYCLREQFTAFVDYAYSLGIRDFFCPGDVIEGFYRHAMYERSSESQDDQQGEFLDALPHRPDTRVFLIDGNHDFTATEKTGVESGRNLVRLARERGRENLHFFGSRGALIKYGDTKIEMWHPKKGNGYALSYQLQNKIRDTAPERLPHILLTGHTHQYVKFRRQNVWAFYCGTFQHGDAPYGRSIGGDVSMGGLLIDWRIDEDGVVRSLGDKFELAHHEAKTFDVAV